MRIAIVLPVLPLMMVPQAGAYAAGDEADEGLSQGVLLPDVAALYGVAEQTREVVDGLNNRIGESSDIDEATAEDEESIRDSGIKMTTKYGLGEVHPENGGTVDDFVEDSGEGSSSSTGDDSSSGDVSGEAGSSATDAASEASSAVSEQDSGDRAMTPIIVGGVALVVLAAIAAFAFFGTRSREE